jgi:hypothetical protein
MGPRANRDRSHRWLLPAIAFASFVLGCAACVHYGRAGLQLSHYDARGHLVVARRIIDSITPGWVQIGAVWLPLPHLLNMLPVQVDALYRTGASAIAMSLIAGAIAASACGWIIFDATRSRLAALVGALVFAANPNVLYLQATPMTEPLLLALTTAGVAAAVSWIARGDIRRRRLASLLLAGACLTRYEAWPLTFAALAASTLAIRWHGRAWRKALGDALPIAVYPAIAIAGFLVLSRLTVGEWLVSSGFYVPDNPSLRKPLDAALSIMQGTRALTGTGALIAAGLGLTGLIITVLRSRARASLMLVLSLTATAALPLYAFVSGHPFRVRYMVPLAPAVAVLAGMAIGYAGRTRVLVAVLVAAVVAIEAAPFDPRAPMVLEAQWDRANAQSRRAVTACLAGQYRGEKIMASMGSLGHYMQELSHEGFALRDFLHEGNGAIWRAALHAGPRLHVGWVLIEEKAEGGDMLASRARANPRFLEGFARTCDGGGVALYRRLSPL